MFDSQTKLELIILPQTQIFAGQSEACRQVSLYGLIGNPALYNYEE